MTKTYKIPVIWQATAIIEVEANSIEEAAEKANSAPLPRDSNYIEDSFEVDYEGIYFHNKCN